MDVNVGGIRISEQKLKALPAEQLKFLISVGTAGLKMWAPCPKTNDVKKAVKVLKKHFKTNNIQEAIVKGVQYAAQALALGRGRTNRSALGKRSRTSRREQKVTSAN